MPAIAGFGYISFITDVYSRRILGWRVHHDEDHPAGALGAGTSPVHPPTHQDGVHRRGTALEVEHIDRG